MTRQAAPHLKLTSREIVLFTPGEVNATGYQGYATLRTLTGQFAEAVGGAVIVLERRCPADNPA